MHVSSESVDTHFMYVAITLKKTDMDVIVLWARVSFQVLHNGQPLAIVGWGARRGVTRARPDSSLTLNSFFFLFPQPLLQR